MDRRTFLTGSVAGVAAAAGVGRLQAKAPAAKEQAVLKLGSQAGRIPGKTLRDRVLKLQDWGGVGIELGGGANVKQVKDALKGTNVKVSAMCWGSCGGKLVSPDKDTRAAGFAAIKRALQIAGEIESTGVVFVPCFKNQSKMKVADLDKMLIDIMPAIGDFAQKCNSRVLFEPLNRGEAYYLRQLSHVARLCNEMNNPGVCMMGDFYHMNIEEKCDETAFVAAGKWLHHIHLASGARKMPGQDHLVNRKPERSFVAGFKGLKRIGYQDYCSLECGVAKGTKADQAIPTCFRFLEKQWAEAKI